MPIVIAHQPNAAVLSGAANMAGLGQFRQRQEDIALKQAAMAQDDIQQQRSIAARQQEQMFGAQQQMMQNAQQRAMQLFMLQQNQGFDQQNQQRQFEQQRALQEGSARNQQEYLGAQLNKQKEYADYTSGIRAKEDEAARTVSQGYAQNALNFTTPTPAMEEFRAKRAEKEQQYDYNEIQTARLKEIDRERAKIANDLATGNIDMAAATDYRDRLDAREMAVDPSVKKVDLDDKIKLKTRANPELGVMLIEQPDGSLDMKPLPKTVQGNKPSESTENQKALNSAYESSLLQFSQPTKRADGTIVEPDFDAAVEKAWKARERLRQLMDRERGLSPDQPVDAPQSGVGMGDLKAAESRGQQQQQPSPPPPPPVDPSAARGANPSPYAGIPGFNGEKDGMPIILDPNGARQLKPGTKFIGADGKRREVNKPVDSRPAGARLSGESQKVFNEELKQVGVTKDEARFITPEALEDFITPEFMENRKKEIEWDGKDMSALRVNAMAHLKRDARRQMAGDLKRQYGIETVSRGFDGFETKQRPLKKESELPIGTKFTRDYHGDSVYEIYEDEGGNRMSREVGKIPELKKPTQQQPAQAQPQQDAPQWDASGNPLNDAALSIALTEWSKGPMNTPPPRKPGQKALFVNPGR